MLVKYAAQLEKIEDLDDLWQGVVETLATAGIDHAVYLTVDASFENPFYRCTNESIYDKTPVQDDPFLRYACETYDILPIGTVFVDGYPFLNQQERDFVKRAGITAALGIPMRLHGTERFGGFIVGTGLDKITFNRKILPRAEEIRLFCLLMHRRIEELTSTTPKPAATDFREPLLAPTLPQSFDALSPREREVVYLLARGRSRREAANICGISVHTISDYAKSGYRKLGVNNRAQAAAILLQSATPLAP